MARVRATQYRVVIQHRDEAGHRLASKKGVWSAIPSIGILLLDCPKCPEPQPEPVECESMIHWPDEILRPGWRYCPRCGVALPAKQEE